MMNSQFAIDHADQLADRVISEETELAKQLALAWKRCFGKPIENSVLVEMMEFVDKQTVVFQSRDGKLTPEAAHRMALASACQAMLSSNEFLYVD